MNIVSKWHNAAESERHIQWIRELTRMLTALGLTVVRYTNDEVLRNIEGVFENLISGVWGSTE